MCLLQFDNCLMLCSRGARALQVPGETKVTIPWFDPATGVANFKVHPLNDRGNRQSVLRHMNKIKEMGVVASARGDPYAVVSKGSCGPAKPLHKKSGF